MFKEEEKPTSKQMIEQLRRTQLILNVMPEYKIYILICAAFSPEVEMSYEDKFAMIQGALNQLLASDTAG